MNAWLDVPWISVFYRSCPFFFQKLGVELAALVSGVFIRVEFFFHTGQTRCIYLVYLSSGGPYRIIIEGREKHMRESKTGQY